jgi:hypothetical protein
MGYAKDVYELKEDLTNDPTFFFISKGQRDIIKVVQYSFVQQWQGKNVYNLGFGDYEPANENVADDANTNNGDAYKVFHTVLSTIPAFFKKLSDGIIMVRGSDSVPGFVENCKLTCTRNCIDDCKKYNRRMSVYQGYVNKNYSELTEQYCFWGGREDAWEGIVLEPYEGVEKYDAVLVYQKHLIL